MAKTNTSSSNPRAVSRDILKNWKPDGEFATNLIDQAARRHALDARDRALVNTLVLGVLRNITLLDHWIGLIRSKGPLKPGLRWILRQGLFELMMMRTPAHATVSQTVKLAKRFEKPVVNAILRRAVSDTAELNAMVAQLPLATRFSLPEHMVERWEQHHGRSATIALCEWMNEPATFTFRANPLAPNAEHLLARNYSARPVEDQPGFFTADSLPLEAIEDGLCYVQDPSTATAPTLLKPNPGERVLDACAAPGGKSSILAALMNNRGELVCVDQQEKRVAMTEQNLTRMGVTCASFLCHDWLENDAFTPELKKGQFDRILADVPCSNSGVMRRRVDVRWRLASQQTFREMQRIQLAIVDKLIPLLSPGGTLVYSTCSIEPEENEEVVQSILERHPALSASDELLMLPFITDTDGGYAAALRLAEV